MPSCLLFAPLSSRSISTAIPTAMPCPALPAWLRLTRKAVLITCL